MKNIPYLFNKFLNTSLRILLLIPLLGSILYIFLVHDHSLNLVFSICFSIIFIILVGWTYYGLKNDYRKSIIITIILIAALIIRILWFYSLDSIPVGDFNRMFISAEDYLNGSTYMFKETYYFSRFPHMTITVLYFSSIMRIFSNPLYAIRFINIIFSMINIILLFFISIEVFNNKKKSIWVLLISSFYPPMIIYNNVYCSENLAIPLLLLSIFLFLKASNETNKNNYFLVSLSGASLGIMQLFRPIGYILIIAYTMYISLYFKEKLKIKLIHNLSITLMFIIPFIFVSYTLISLNITEHALWQGTEPISISVLKGTNIESGGRWNQEDSDLFSKYDENYEKVDQAAKEIIKQRLTTTSAPKLLAFYVFKYASQWRSGDFGGIYWSQDGLNEAYNKDYYLNILGKDEGKMLLKLNEEMQIYVQIFFISLLILSYVGLYKKKNIANYKIYLFYIIFCGASLQCLITEAQVRYTYPFSWIFIILAITAFNKDNINIIGGKI